jgi:hypothetical protein
MDWGTPQNPSNLTKILANASLRSSLITNLATLVTTYSLDGICVDWEGDDVTQSVYHAFLTELRAALSPGKLLAVCGDGNPNYFPWFNAVTDTPLVDFFEVMLYDIGHPVLCSQSDFQYHATLWINAGFPAAKLDLGIPAYSADNNGMIGSYGQVISEFNADISVNQISTSNANGFAGNNLTVDGNVLWWNGVDLAVNKTQWAQANNMGGLMLFAVDYDAVKSPKSLLTAIFSTLNSTIQSPPSVATSLLPNGIASTAYSQTLNATGGTSPYTWSIASGMLPAGLTISSGGVISGTPTTAGGPTLVTFKVMDSAGANATKSIPITIANPTWDINKDGTVNILEMASISQHWGETGTPGWIAQDVNNDGIVNSLDMIIVGQHWTP